MQLTKYQVYHIKPGYNFQNILYSFVWFFYFTFTKSVDPDEIMQQFMCVFTVKL